MIGPYRLERVLGTGSFATVWLAFDDVLDREVAVKILADNWSRDHDVRRRFLAEARVLLTVESPRIVRGFHIGETPDGQPYLVMAYADRGTVGDRIDQRRREGRTFDARETVGIATEVAYALVDVHASGHLHRDVKPTNVLIRSSSTQRNIAGLAADETVVLGDFGLARGLDLSALTMVAGSPGYVAPEQAAGLTQLDRRADLYPLGRMMLEMLTGDPGGRATTMAGAATEQVDVADLLGNRPERTRGAEPGARRPDHPARGEQPRRTPELGGRGRGGPRRDRRRSRRRRQGRQAAADRPAIVTALDVARRRCGRVCLDRHATRRRTAASVELVASAWRHRRRNARRAGGTRGARRGADARWRRRRFDDVDHRRAPSAAARHVGQSGDRWAGKQCRRRSTDRAGGHAASRTRPARAPRRSVLARRAEHRPGGP